MNKIMAACVALLTLSGLAGPAAAFTPGGAFTLNGVLNRSVSGGTISCAVAMRVSGAQVTAVTFSPGAPSCATFTAAGLPWGITGLSTSAVQITGLTVNSPLVPSCGPATVTLPWSNTPPGTIAFSNLPIPPACVYSGSLSANPAQTLP